MSSSTRWIRAHIRISHLVFFMLVGLGMLYPQEISGRISEITFFFASTFNWFILLSCMGFLVFCLLLAFGRFGGIRLGKPEDRPQFSTPSWLAMLFAAGMGTGLVFYGAAEPLFHMVSPPPVVDGVALDDALSAKRAMVLTYVHWGLQAWAIFAVCALAIAYFSFRKGLPMLASSPLRALWPHPRLEPLWHVVDLVAVLAVVFGLVSSLAQGVVQMQSGLTLSGFNWDYGTGGYMIILAALVVCYTGSALSGLDKGVKTLSNINMVVCVGVMVFILVTGPTHFVLETFVTSLGDYTSRFIALGMNLRHYSGNTEWTQDWTINYFLWWIAWGPFVGVFIARVSRGRTIREFITGVLFVPTLFSFLWFSVLGGTAIYMQLSGETQLGELTLQNLSATTFALLELLPLTELTHVIALFLLFIFLVTSADSGAYVLGMFSSNGNTSPPQFQKLFWGAMIALVTAGALTNADDLRFLRAVAMVGAIPYLFIMIAHSVAMWRALSRECPKEAPKIVPVPPPARPRPRKKKRKAKAPLSPNL